MSIDQMPVDTAFVISHKYCWSVLSSAKFTSGRVASIFSYSTTGILSHVGNIFPTGPAIAFGSVVEPSNGVIGVLMAIH